VIPKRRAARTPLPCREATVLHGSKYKAKIDFWCFRATICGPKMSVLSYFAIQIQSWFFRTQSKSKIFQVQMKSGTLEKCSLFTTKIPHFFPLTQSKSCPDPKFWSALHSGFNPNSTKFAIVRIHPSPSLLRTHTCTLQSSENLIVTKVSLRKINNYQDHNRLQLEKAKFHRLHCDGYLEFGFHWTGEEQMPRPRCVFAVRSSSMKRWFQLNWEYTSLPITLTFKLKRWFIFKDCCKLIQGNGNYFRKQWLCQKELN